MTIKAIETLRLGEFPNLTWVIVEDADGVRGLGETYRGAAEVEAYIHETAAPKLLGLDAVGVDPVRPLLRPYVGHQAAGAEIRGNSAIDIAMWDLWGKRTGQPVWRLLGGRCRETIRTYNTCAVYRYMRKTSGQNTGNWGLGANEGPYEDLEAFLTDAGALAESLLDQGITAMKIWPFDPYAETSGGMAITPAEMNDKRALVQRARRLRPVNEEIASLAITRVHKRFVAISQPMDLQKRSYWFSDNLRHWQKGPPVRFRASMQAETLSNPFLFDGCWTVLYEQQDRIYRAVLRRPDDTRQ